ncbi:MAG: polyprenyl synthetase family protein [Candidatus Dormibacteraeota bacterium]|nr:polyprenyl synthetase family protein [Candidatus Dormibacteraeota bacterium]
MAVALHHVEDAAHPARNSAADQVPVALGRMLPPLHEALRASAPAPGTRLGAMSSYHLGWTDAQGRPGRGASGKFVRGCLALWAAEQCGGDVASGLPAAAAVEWIHNFTLVHDDIQDGDVERRHRPTVWAVWGSAQAINAGDGMHAIAYRALLSGRDRPAARLRAAAAINEAIVAVIEGQCLDLALEGQIDTTVTTYLHLARAKTGALIGAALEAGALLGGADSRRAALLRRAGIEMGIAFQVRDDWLGTWGDSAVTGKGCGGDLARRKVTYPVVAGHARLRGAAQRHFRRLYRQPGGDEDVILALLDEARAGDAVTDELARRSRSAMRLVEMCGLSPAALGDFQAFVDFIVERAA